MSLDPSVKKVLELLKNIELSSLTVEQARKLMDMGIERQIKEDVKSTSEFKITYNDISLSCRLYEPFTTTDALIIYYHGGG
ncbi:MAG: hypothetical protein GYA16_09055, partial [Spirochaetes bacterium]|nr:hypothetical protein [Spirochaetota bacterium]